MNYKEFYTALGQLVYAIAKADGSIQTEESAAIFHFVISHLVGLEKESGDGKSALEAFNLEREFHKLEKEDATVKEAYESFVTFLDENRDNCDERFKTICINVMEKVAGAYNDIEESEKAIIDKIKEKISSL